ncbi:MAG: 30S ribosome-binding factor RbfA [Rhodospirillales bacterium]
MSRKKSASAPGQRQLRVGEELRHVLARLFERGALNDPALSGVSITVTEVRVSPDLKNATAFVVPLGGGGGAETVKALNHAQAYLRGLAAGEMRLRHAPRLGFVLDTSFDNASRIERILGEIASVGGNGKGGGGGGGDGA